MKMTWLESIPLWTLLATLLIMVIECAPTTSREHCKRLMSHNLILGELNADYELLHKETVSVKYATLAVVYKTIVYPPKGEKPSHIIKHIKLIDHNKENYGACPMIEEGGVDEKNVVINFESQFSRGINFDVEIYGKKISSTRRMFECSEDSSAELS